MSHHARDACSRAERGRAFGRRSPAHLDGLRSLLLHASRTRTYPGSCCRELPLLNRTRPREAVEYASSQHVCKARGGGSE
eukprot:7031713-Prymnesium_polylepis.1